MFIILIKCILLYRFHENVLIINLYLLIYISLLYKIIFIIMFHEISLEFHFQIQSHCQFNYFVWCFMNYSFTFNIIILSFTHETTFGMISWNIIGISLLIPLHCPSTARSQYIMFYEISLGFYFQYYRIVKLSPCNLNCIANVYNLSKIWMMRSIGRKK